MRILVTGSEGNVGRWLVPHLRGLGHDVLRCDIQNGHADDYMVVDVKNSGDMTKAFSRHEPEVVFHMAAMVSRITAEESPHITVDTNVSGTNNVIQLCMQRSAKLIYFSTSEVYGNTTDIMTERSYCAPNNLYGVTKLMGEWLVSHYRSSTFRPLIIRPFMMYDERETKGAHRSAMVRFTDALANREKITVHEGARRSWLYMGDAVQIMARLMGKSGIVNIGNPNVVSMLDVARMIADEIGRSHDLIKMAPLPPQMTLVKQPDLTRQTNLTGFIDFVPIEVGVERLVRRMCS